MKSIKLITDKVAPLVTSEQIKSLAPLMVESCKLLHSGEGKGNDFLGWVDLPKSITASQIEDINATALSLRELSEIIIVIGIGGSYLGAKSVIDALSGNFDYLKSNPSQPTVIFAGQNISEDYMVDLIEATHGRDISTIVISKSGTTTEPAIAFRVIKEEIERRYGKAEAAKRIVAVTDEKRGALRILADQEGYKSYIIPDNVGGRFSVLTPVGLLPLAAAGINIAQLVAGAADMATECESTDFDANIAMQYAAVRNALYNSGKKVEILASYEPRLQNIAEWWKQLYGESEGKEGKGIFPASVSFTADLHSMGQYIQQGERMLFETVISVTRPDRELVIKSDEANLDQLNFLAGRRLSQVNLMAEMGTMLAHVDGGVPNIRIEIEQINAYNIGALLFFFEKACGISGYALGVNPFDQPGVEDYKKNMFALLGKPGFEDMGAELRARLEE